MQSVQACVVLVRPDARLRHGGQDGNCSTPPRWCPYAAAAVDKREPYAAYLKLGCKLFPCYRSSTVESPTANPIERGSTYRVLVEQPSHATILPVRTRFS